MCTLDGTAAPACHLPETHASCGRQRARTAAATCRPLWFLCHKQLSQTRCCIAANPEDALSMQSDRFMLTTDINVASNIGSRLREAIEVCHPAATRCCDAQSGGCPPARWWLHKCMLTGADEGMLHTPGKPSDANIMVLLLASSCDARSCGCTISCTQKQSVSASVASSDDGGHASTC